VTSKDIRNGVGHRAYRRAATALKKDTQLKGYVCYWCKQPIDTTLPSTHRLSFTADHPDAVGNGGALVGQGLKPMHRSCNAKKGNSVDVDVEEFGAT
jgi:hypothetical protein